MEPIVFPRIICPDCLWPTRLNSSGKIRRHRLGPGESDHCLSSGSYMGVASYYGKIMSGRNLMELEKDSMNVITIYSPDQIELAFDQIPNNDWQNVWDHTEFPHPLITVDINHDGVPFQVMALGSFAPKLLELYAQWIRDIKKSKQNKNDLRLDGDRRALINSLSDAWMSNTDKEAKDG